MVRKTNYNVFLNVANYENERENVVKIEHQTYKELISFLDEYAETRQDATSAVPEHNTTKVKHHATDARNMTLCEKVITVDMTKLLNNLLVRIYDKANPLYESSAYSNLLAATSPSSPTAPCLLDMAETFSVCRQNKFKYFDSIDDLEYYRLRTNLKGKKTQSIKKNIQCQTFETAAEAERMLLQTREFFDFFLSTVCWFLMCDDH